MVGEEKKALKPHEYKYTTPLRNIVIIIICVLGMGVGLWFFWRDIVASNQARNEKPAGVVFWVNNSVKQHSVQRLQWTRLERNSSVYNGDIISSAAFSDVKINFANGEILELSENTSVSIRYRNGEIPSIVLLEGEIEVQSSQLNMTVYITGEDTGQANYKHTINLDPRTNMGIKSSGNLVMKVYQGSGTVTSAGKYYNIAAGETLKSDRENVFSPASDVIMLSPRNGTRILRTSREKEAVNFQWRNTNAQNDSGVIMEISERRDFSDLAGRWYWENVNSSEIEFPPGTYYWKLFNPASSENFDSGRLDIIYTTASRALFPADNSVVSYLPGKRDLRFSWTVPEEAEAVLLEVADNSEMNRPYLRQLVKRTKNGRGTYRSSELGAGQWYWRVYPVFPGRSEGYIPVENPSPASMFILSESAQQPESNNRSGTPHLEPGNIPRHIFPPDDYTLEANRTPDLLFSWRSPVSRSNRFQIARIPDFSSSVILDVEVIGTNFQCPLLKPGYYYWRLIGAGPENSSHPSRLVVIPSLPGPRIETPAANEVLRVTEGVPIRFGWEQVNYANYFKFNLYLAGRDQPLREVSFISNNSVMVYFDPRTTGRFYWTVQGFITPTEIATGRNGLISQSYFYINPDSFSAQGDQVSWTVPRIANMQSYSGEVESPIKLISPASGINIPGMQALRYPLQARWSSDEPIQNIQLIVSRTTDPLSDPRAIVKSVRGTSAEFPPLGEGIWYWIIRADTYESRGATPGDPFWLNVLAIPQLPAPKSIQPLDQSIVDLEQLTRDRNITFLWDKVDGANAYIFSFFLDGPTPVLIFTEPPQTELSYVFENLSILNDGNYLWQVEAVNSNINGDIDQRGSTVQHPFTIEIQRSSNIQTRRQGTTYGL